MKAVDCEGINRGVANVGRPLGEEPRLALVNPPVGRVALVNDLGPMLERRRVNFYVQSSYTK
jgi:hypothetical protein